MYKLYIVQYKYAKHCIVDNGLCYIFLKNTGENSQNCWQEDSDVFVLSVYSIQIVHYVQNGNFDLNLDIWNVQTCFPLLTIPKFEKCNC